MRASASAARAFVSLLVLAAPAATVPSALQATAVQQQIEVSDSFPHLPHDGLFPLCTGCHEGVPSGDESEYYPEPSLCIGCHDGVDVEPLERDWSPPVPDGEPDLLSFRHPEHVAAVAEVGDSALSCRSCHAPSAEARIEVHRLVADASCLGCHAHEAVGHYEEAECTTCHIPLAESRLPVDRIADLPQPAAHEGEDFLLEEHGAAALEGTSDCATCHTRDLCTSCHVAGNEETLETLRTAPPSLELPAYAVVYPTPPTHQASGFRIDHGDVVPGVGCETCHTQDDCASCHLPPLPRGARDLPAAQAVQAPGVGMEVDAPASHDTPFFQGDHGIMAASDPAECATCHTRPYCEACHEAAAQPSFHPTNYVASHASDAWGGMSECSNCHQVSVSCRACHVDAGLTKSGGGRLGPGYHDAEPQFLLRHGQAARQSLESCASCHTQRECLQCHSQTGAFQISPHGDDFDAARAREKNPVICSACHIGNPLASGGG